MQVSNAAVSGCTTTKNPSKVYGGIDRWLVIGDAGKTRRLHSSLTIVCGRWCGGGSSRD